MPLSRWLVSLLLGIVFTSSAFAADPINGLIADYYSDESLEKFVARRLDPNIDWQWDKAGPLPGMSGDNFSIRWSGWIKAPKAGKYNLILVGNEGARLFLDEKPFIAEWKRGDCAPSAVADLTGEPQPIVIEYFEHTRGARLTFFWQPLGFPTPSIVPSSVLFPTEKLARAKVNKKKLPERGLIADYFDVDFKRRIGRGLLHRTNSMWCDFSVDSGVPADAGARYSGFIVPAVTGRYKFTAHADDVLQVWIDEKPLLEATLANNEGYSSAVYAELRANTAHSLRMEYLDSAKWGGFYLHWTPPRSDEETFIPLHMLYPNKASLPKEIEFGGK